MFVTMITIQRPEGTVLLGTDGRPAVHLRVEVMQASDMEQVRMQSYEYHGKYDFKLSTFTWYACSLIRMGDVLIDEQVLDPQTGQPYKYRVTGRPKDYLQHHQECHVEVVVGQ